MCDKFYLNVKFTSSFSAFDFRHILLVTPFMSLISSKIIDHLVSSPNSNIYSRGAIAPHEVKSNAEIFWNNVNGQTKFFLNENAHIYSELCIKFARY